MRRQHCDTTLYVQRQTDDQQETASAHGIAALGGKAQETPQDGEGIAAAESMSTLLKLQVDAETLAKLQELAGEPLAFTPPEPELECSFCGWTDGEHAEGCPYDTIYHSDEVDTRDLLAGHFVGPMAGK